MTPSNSSRSSCNKSNKNELDKNGGSSITGDKINDKIANLSNNIKKISSKASFFTSKASLTFI